MFQHLGRSGLLYFLANFVLASTMVMLFPNARVPALFFRDLLQASFQSPLGDPASGRSCSSVLGVWFVVIL